MQEAPELPVPVDLFGAIVEASPDAVAVIEANSRVRFGNAALRAWLTCDAASATIEHLLTLIHPDDLAAVRLQLAHAATTPGHGITAAFRVVRCGRIRHVEAHAIDLTADPAVRGTILTIHDITDRVHRDNALRTARAGNQVLVRSADEMSLLSGMCQTLVHVGGYQLAWVGYAQDDDARTVLPVASAGDTDYVKGIHVSWGDNELGRGPTGVAIRTNTVQVEADLHASRTFAPWRARAISSGFRTSCVIPLSQDGRVIGALSIYSDEPGAFDEPSLNVLQELADDLIYGIAKLRGSARVKAAFDATVEALGTVSELRDPYTAGHQHRMGLLASAIARRMGLPDDMAMWIRIAGELHDIGKVVVPAEILARPGKLSDVEMQIVRGHVEAGYDIVRRIDFPGHVAEMVRQHHERLDGSGYPQGLRGDDVLMGSRILAVADVVEAMTNHRPYRPALGLDSALEEITAGAGTVFDSEVVATCVALFEEGAFSFDDSGESESRTPSGPWVQPLTRLPLASEPDVIA